MRGLLLISLVALATKYSAAVPKCPPGGEDGGLLGNPADCNSYYECVNGSPILMKCPPGLQWADQLNRCDFPDVAKCTESETEIPTTQATTTEGEISNPSTLRPTECPAEDDPNHDVLLPNPEDCGSFFKCLGGVPQLIKCPPDQQWSIELNRCDLPEIAKCHETATKPTELPTTAGPTTPRPTKCPSEDDPNHDVLLPNPDDCGSFFKCLGGEPHLILCPPGQEWSIELSRCDLPEIAHCQKSVNKKIFLLFELRKDDRCPEEDGEEDVLLPNPGDCTTFYKCNNGELVIQECPAGLHWNDNAKLCDYPEVAGCQKLKKSNLLPFHLRKDDRCPEEDGEEDVLLPNPQDCTTFYKCNNGELVIQDCPAGLHWNDQAKYCDYPEAAGCQKFKKNVMFLFQLRKDDRCPEEDGEEDVLLPNPGDCTTFYKCNNGELVIQDCPAGLHWNDQAKYCDYPQAAGCQKNVLFLFQLRKDDRCPEEDGEEDVLLPNLGDCTTFYKCNNGELVIQSCPVGLHWNDQGKYCDYPTSAGCQKAKIFAKNEWPTECPAENGMYDFFLPNLDDCTTYFRCDNGRKILMDCPVGTLWDAPMQRCDHAANARCASE